MSRKTTTHKKPRMVQALAVLAVVLGAGLIGAAPARADHGPDVGFSFSFGFPFPFSFSFPSPFSVLALLSVCVTFLANSFNVCSYLCRGCIFIKGEGQ